MKRRGFCLTIAAGALAGCAKKNARVTIPPPPRASGSGRPSVPAAPPPVAGQTETGAASWYGHPYHGRQAADGEIYDMETMVAAHRTLPFQTWVRVRNLKNDKTVDVRIIDRGPFVDGRIIDLSHAAAQQIELIGPGVAQVELTIVSAPASPEPALFAVQVGAFRERANADRAERNMMAAYGAAKSIERPGSPSVWRVLAGRENSPEAAELLAKRIREEQKTPEAFVVRLDP
ncbi:MAG TPA: septal ring lytic transglycosylase RlpA family protein [Bryobacteraceae bacterium]|nr:septal ring lytic transglycosylase RlpA family protein [Bryobacteraceae bacterium]